MPSNSVPSPRETIEAYAYPNGKNSPELVNSIQKLNDNVLELKNVSYIRTFSTGRCLSKLFNPPVTAQFLKDIALRVHGGEIMGIVGAGGSGKTTLLNVIARRVQGSTGGAITLNHRTMTERTFQNTCAYVSFKQNLIEHLTGRGTLKHHAELALPRSLTESEKEKRVCQMLRDFDLLDHADKKVINLSESARRRLLVAMHAIRDPVLIVIDDPSKTIDPLSSYHLMFLFSRYVKKYNRIGVVSMRTPRSDIYPLLDRLTVLFFGEVMYSGYTKMMPQYFRSVGFPCPSTENPAVYFLSLATVDRETSARYIETQEQAIKLIELFKTDGETYSRFAGIQQNDSSTSVNPFLPLCHLGRPNYVSKFFALARRNNDYIFRNWRLLFARTLSIPLFSLFLFTFYFQIKPSSTSPQTIAGLIFNCMTAFSMITSAVTATSFSSLRNLYYQDSWDNLYGGGIFVSSYLVSTALIDLISIFVGTAIIYWGCQLTPNGLVYFMFSCALWSCCQFAQLHTLCFMLFVKSSYTAASAVITLIGIHVTAAGGFLKSFSTYQHSPTELLYYATYSSIYRFAGAHMLEQQLANLSTGCTIAENRRHTGSPICRWATGQNYMREVYHLADVEHASMNLAFCMMYVTAFAVVTVAFYSLPMPHFIKRKFRYK